MVTSCSEEGRSDTDFAFICNCFSFVSVGFVLFRFVLCLFNSVKSLLTRDISASTLIIYDQEFKKNTKLNARLALRQRGDLLVANISTNRISLPQGQSYTEGKYNNGSLN